MDDLKLPLMDSLKLELYGNTTTTLGSQQQQMPSKPPEDLGDQAWVLLKELGNLHIKQAFQKTPKLTPEDQQEFLETIRDIRDKVGKISGKLNGWQARSRQSAIYGSCRDSQFCSSTSCGDFWTTRRPTYQDTRLPKNLLPKSPTSKKTPHHYYKHLPGKCQEGNIQHPCLCKTT